MFFVGSLCSCGLLGPYFGFKAEESLENLSCGCTEHCRHSHTLRVRALRIVLAALLLHIVPLFQVRWGSLSPNAEAWVFFRTPSDNVTVRPWLVKICYMHSLIRTDTNHSDNAGSQASAVDAAGTRAPGPYNEFQA